jgi:hypothetical protein
VVPALPAQDASDALGSPARLRSTIQTKEGYKTATGEEPPVIRPEDRRLPGAEESMADDEVAGVGLLPDKDANSEDLVMARTLVADAFFLDDSDFGLDYLLTPNSAAALAGCAIVMGGFWGSKTKRPEERTRRRFIAPLRTRGM